MPGRSVRGAETDDGLLNFCTKIQVWHSGFITQDPVLGKPVSCTEQGRKLMQEA